MDFWKFIFLISLFLLSCTAPATGQRLVGGVNTDGGIDTKCPSSPSFYVTKCHYQCTVGGQNCLNCLEYSAPDDCINMNLVLVRKYLTITQQYNVALC